MRRMGGLSSQEKTSIALSNKDLAEIISNPGDRDVVEIKDIIKAKGSLLFTILQNQIGEEEFYSFINNYLSNNQFRIVNVSEFSQSLT